MSKKIQPKQDKTSKDVASNVLFNQQPEDKSSQVVSQAAPNIMIATAPAKKTQQSSKSGSKIEKSASKPMFKTQTKSASKTSSKAINSSKISSSTKTTTKSKSIPLIEKNKTKNSKVVESTPREVLTLPHEHDSYFVYLKNPLEYRRHLLESSRKILYCLKGYQKIVLIRRRKIEEMNKLRTSVKELIYLNKKFNELLPKYNMAVVSHHTEKKQDEIKARSIAPAPIAKKPIIQREKTEIEKLEESLANIESKLRNLQ